jgi:hypothetical protein
MKTVCLKESEESEREIKRVNIREETREAWVEKGRRIAGVEKGMG